MRLIAQLAAMVLQQFKLTLRIVVASVGIVDIGVIELGGIGITLGRGQLLIEPPRLRILAESQLAISHPVAQILGITRIEPVGSDVLIGQ